MQDHWKYNGPPVAVSVAGYLGLIKARPKVVKVHASRESFRDFVSDFRAAGGAMR